MYNKIAALVVAGALALSLSACGSATRIGDAPKAPEVSAGTEASTVPSEAAPVEPAEPAYTVGQQSAIDKANSYLAFMPFSRQGLIDQLVYEQFSVEDSTFAVDTINPDWNALATAKAQSYMDTMGGFSHGSLVDQLIFEGFTPEQAEFGVSSIGL